MTTQLPAATIPTRTARLDARSSRLAEALAGDDHPRPRATPTPSRAAALTLEAAGIHLDASRQRVTADVLAAAARTSRTSAACSRGATAMLGGAHINVTEDRAVLHTALRRPAARPLVGRRAGRRRRRARRARPDVGVRRVGARSATWRGATGERISAVVNIGIGGSDLGPAMAYEALRHYSDRDIDVPLRLQRRPDRPRRGAPRPRPGDDAVHRRVQDVHDAGDDDQRAGGARTGWSPRWARPP